MDLNIAPVQDDPNSTRRESMASSGTHKVEDVSLDLRNGAVSPTNSYEQMNPGIVDPATELTEDDLFKMKSMTMKRAAATSGGLTGELHSAVSVVDSTSNYEDDLHEDDNSSRKELASSPDRDGEQNGTSEESETYTALNAKEAATSQAFTYADVVKSEHKKTIILNGYVFGRERPTNINLNQETVTLLNYPFEPALVPVGEEPHAYRKAFSDAKVYLIGTAHFSAESQQDVLSTIQQTQPDLVMVELCSSRISILSMDEQTLLREARSLNREKIMAIIRQSGLIQGLLHVLLLSTSAHITRQLGMAPGGEFRAAHTGSKQVLNCGLVLGDRPLHITLQRALSSLGFFQKMRFFYHILLTNRMPITPEDVERCKNKDLLEELLKEMAGEFPQLSRILVDERDQYMTNVLHTILQKSTTEKMNACRKTKANFEPVVVVAVVGIGHVAGIVSNWNKHIDCSALLLIPQPTKKAKAFKLVVKLSILVGLGYVGFRVGRAVFGKMSTLVGSNVGTRTIDFSNFKFPTIPYFGRK